MEGTPIGYCLVCENESEECICEDGCSEYDCDHARCEDCVDENNYQPYVEHY